MLKNKILRALKAGYKHLPVGQRVRTYMKDGFYTIFAFALKDTQMYRLWHSLKYGPEDVVMDGLLGQEFLHFQFKQDEQPGKIAIQLHLFYIDLIGEFCKYLQNMPFEFDLLVSIVDAGKKAMVEESFQKVRNLRQCIVRAVPNRGRDVAPFVVGFGDLLDNYEFVAHIHSKKSLYTGTEQKGWRNHLLDGLLGSEDLIRNIFGEFIANKNLGLVYPMPSQNVPYAAYTWLSNRQIGMQLLRRLHVKPNVSDYFDYSAGTMFWARTRAIHRLYSSGITLEDFPEEGGQLDATLAHAIERVFALLAINEGMDYYEIDPAKGIYSVNCGSKNMWQYVYRLESNVEFQMGFDTISFDVFDTLIMRKIAAPSFVNELIGLELEKDWGLSINFPERRLEAEARAREKLPPGRDCSTGDIYKEFAEITGLPAETCEKIRKLEVDTEVRLAEPRLPMVRWLDEYRKAGKRVILTSDMYLTREELERILKKCGIEGYDEVYISSETGLRKDTGDIYRKFIADGLLDRMAHIGDNEMSDCQRPGDLGIGCYHILSSFNLFSMTAFGRYFLVQHGADMGLWGAMLLGVVLWRRFEDPFVLNAATGKLKIRKYYDLGYAVYGPILLTYICWLHREMARDGREIVLFVARDGYFLQPLYEFVMKRLGVEPLPSTYLLASRRSVTLASMRDLEDVYSLLETNYEGKIRDFFLGHFGVEIEDGEEEISLREAQGRQALRDAVARHGREILEKAKQERKAYEAYLASLGVDFSRNIALVDMGYAGTTQYHLSRLMNSDSFIGYYFATSGKTCFGDQAKARMRGCFAWGEEHATAPDGIYKYQLLLEAVLTSPEGQLDYFRMEEGKAVPVYGSKGFAQEHVDSLRSIHVGVQDYCRDVLDTYGERMLDVPIHKELMNAWIAAFVQDKNLLDDSLKEFYAIDDPFCNTTGGNVLDFYRNNRESW